MRAVESFSEDDTSTPDNSKCNARKALLVNILFCPLVYIILQPFHVVEDGRMRLLLAAFVNPRFTQDVNDVRWCLMAVHKNHKKNVTFTRAFNEIKYP